MDKQSISHPWPLVRLGDLGEVNRGRSRHRPRYAPHLYGGPYPFIQTGDIKSSGGRITSHAQTYSEAGLAQSRLWPAGTMCITIAANIAETAILTYPACFPDSVVGFIPDESKCDIRFIEYTFRYLRRRIQHEASGSVQDNINLATLDRLRFPLPSVPEQRCIADILGTLDDKIELNRRMNETLEAMARRLFKSWFVDFDPVHAKSALRRQHPKLSNAALSRRALPNMAAEIAELFPDTFDDSTFGRIPEGWNAGTVPDVIDVNPSRAIAKGTDVPWLEMANMPTRSARALTWERREFKSGTKFINGDTLVARITPCLENGKTAFVDFLEDDEVGAGSTEYIVIRPKPPLPPVFAYLLARTDDFRQHLITNMTGTSGRQRAPADCLNTFPLVTPPKEIAELFARATSDLFVQMKTIDDESKALTVTRDKFLPRLLAGDLQISGTRT